MEYPMNLNLKATLASLPPGFCIQFHPSEEQLFSYYLSNKNNHSLPCSSATDSSLFGFDVIKEIDLYNHEPSDLPVIACFPFVHAGSKRSSYFFVAKEAGEQEKRKAKGGYWKSEGWAQDVVGGEEALVLGTRKTFVFYVGDLSCAILTDWFMYEYTPVDPQQGSFVLCHVFLKSHHENINLEHVLSSYAVESNVAMHDVGIQHDGASTFGIGEAEMHDEKPVDADNKITRSSMKLISEPNDQIMRGPAEGFQLLVDIPKPNVLVRPSDGIISGSSKSDDAVADDLMFNSSILEEGFIELADLVCPLSGIDSSDSSECI